MKSLSRYSKKIVSLMIAVMALTIGICSFSFESKAYGESSAMDFYVKYSEPTCNEYSGYFSVGYSSNGTYRMYTYFWVFLRHGTTEYSTDEANFMYVQVDSNKVYFQPYCTSKGGIDVVLCCYDNNDDFHYITNQYIPMGTQTFGIYEDDYSSTPVAGYCFGGNALLSTYSSLKDVEVPTIHWNEAVDASQLDEQMYQIISSLNNIDYDTSYIISQLQNIYNQNVSIQQKLDNVAALLNQIKAEQEESNSWLEKIWNSLQEFLGLEGEESTEDLAGKDESVEMTEKEDELLNDNDVSTDDLKLELDSNSSGVVWARVEEIVTAHETLFTTIISLLTLGIVALILNR